jgi:hypothetical protein
MAQALAPLHPSLRGAPPGPPFQFDLETIWRGLNLTLVTAARRPRAAAGRFAQDGDPGTLIYLKRASGRPKGLERIAALEAILEEQRKIE